MRRRLPFLFLATVLMLSAGWTFVVRAERTAVESERVLPVPAQSAASAAGDFDPAILDAFRWRSIGPLRGGRSIAVSGVRGRPKEGYFGAAGGGLWKTTDGGMNWTHIGFSDSDAIAKIRIHPTNPDIVFVADFGKYSVPSDERGVFKSADGGTTWKKVLFKDPKTGGADVAIDRRNPNVMFAALWEAYRVEYQMSSGGPGSGLYKSTDGGETWREMTRNPGLPQGLVGKMTIGISGADSNR